MKNSLDERLKDKLNDAPRDVHYLTFFNMSKTKAFSKHTGYFDTGMLITFLFFRYFCCITTYYLGLKSTPNEAAALATYLLVCIQPALSSCALA